MSKSKILFWAKASLIILFGFGGIQALLFSPYRIAFETQSILKCLPQSLWVLNTEVNDSNIKKGSLVRFGTDNYVDFYPEGIQLLKMVVGVEGDVVNFTPDGFYINGEYFGTLPLSSVYKPALEGVYTLGPDELWVTGSSETTLDSRYIGPIQLQEVNAHAYALF